MELAPKLKVSDHIPQGGIAKRAMEQLATKPSGPRLDECLREQKTKLLNFGIRL